MVVVTTVKHFALLRCFINITNTSEIVGVMIIHTLNLHILKWVLAIFSKSKSHHDEIQ